MVSRGLFESSQRFGVGQEEKGNFLFEIFVFLFLSISHKHFEQISDICGTFRWGPFIPVSGEDTLLTLLLMVSKYGVKSVPVVEMGNPSVQNIITQSSIVNLLNECDGLPWFENVANKTLEQLGLPIMDYEHLVKVRNEFPLLMFLFPFSDHGVNVFA